jgi:hypothetical protein
MGARHQSERRPGPARAGEACRNQRCRQPQPGLKPGTNGPDNPLAPGTEKTLAHEEESKEAAAPSSTVDVSAMVNAPQRMTITQQGDELRIHVTTADGQQVERSFKAGATQTIAWPNGGAEASTGWHGPVFIVTTRPKKGRMREDDYALDDAGHLILTVQTRKIDIKLVYDRVRTDS